MSSRIEHYHQAIALVVADTFEQARAAARLVRVNYVPAKGAYISRQQKTLRSNQNPISAAPPTPRSAISPGPSP
jgi:xanthine dehydrogenase YagR molybdenum-binding subunit